MAKLVAGGVGPGLKPKLSPPIINVSPSSWVTLNVWPVVTETVPMNWTKTPVVLSSIKLDSDPGMFWTILDALLLASHAAIVASVAEKLKGEFTSNVTFGIVAGTFAGIAFWEVASGTRQSEPEMMSA